MEFACFPCVSVGSIQVLQLPSTVEEHACEVNWRPLVRCVCESSCLVLNWRLVGEAPAGPRDPEPGYVVLQNLILEWSNVMMLLL